MQDYIARQNYVAATLRPEDFSAFEPHRYERLKVEPDHPVYLQAEAPFSHAMFRYPSLPLFLGKFELSEAQTEALDLNVLRLLIRLDDRNAKLFMPSSLGPLADLVLQNVNYHRQFFPANADCFVYLTVRICDYETMYYRSATGWHIDGFQGARIPRHKVEQNCFWSNVNPTEFSLQPYFCEGLNPRIHDINEFFDRTTNESFAIKGVENGIYFVNPYHVHRVSPQPFDGKRVFVRINFSPVLIEDRTNTPNPCFPDIGFPDREDVRNFLHGYPVDERAAFGFR